MTFRLRNLHQLKNTIRVPIPKDPDGFVGRECPEKSCLGYFKIKPGTGLEGEGLPCYCPYCGHRASPDHFWTPDQIEFARTSAMRKVGDAIYQDLKSLEFRHRPRGILGIGMSLKVSQRGGVPIGNYQEKTLETHIACSSCSLEYAIYGRFAFCADCGSHNSHQILERNVALIAKQVALAEQVTDDPDFRRHLLEDALENCVSSLDGFGRETCRVRSSRSHQPDKCDAISFQNLAKASKRLSALFGIDLQGAVARHQWQTANRGFMKRHVIAHRAGVVDQQYLDESSDESAVLGRLVPLDTVEILAEATAAAAVGSALISLIPAP